MPQAVDHLVLGQVDLSWQDEAVRFHHINGGFIYGISRPLLKFQHSNPPFPAASSPSSISLVL
jgi:hypothetical protein